MANLRLPLCQANISTGFSAPATGIYTEYSVGCIETTHSLASERCVPRRGRRADKDFINHPCLGGPVDTI
jgi:hypothetical protein